jgi:hypothetical protein
VTLREEALISAMSKKALAGTFMKTDLTQTLCGQSLIVMEARITIMCRA